jgi:aminocarboxymuconate-semialdehyde decarboxylase
MIIDVHGHLAPPDLLAEIGKGWGLRGRQTVAADHEGFERHCRTSRLDGQTGDRPPRDRRLGPTWFGHELPAAEGEPWCHLFNDAQLAAAKSERRFVPLASVPLQDGAHAAAVLKAAVAAGFPARDRQRG